MTDDKPHRVPRSKGRSASICATGSTSMEAIPPTGDGTPTQRRRRPAARSQSARMTNRRSVRNRTTPHAHCDKAQSNSEPKLTEDSTPDVSPNIRRKGSQRKGTSMYQRKSTAFLDVPETRKSAASHSNTEGEEDEDSYRLRSFSFTSKAKWGFPLTKLDLKEIVKKALDSKGILEKRFIDNRPGKKWLTNFLKRQEDTLKTRLSHNIKRARAGVTPETIEEYFKELAESLKDVAPEAIINYDETNMQDDPGKTKVIVHRTCKRAEIIKDSSKTGFSVMFAGTASGKTLPVYVVYKSPTNLYHTWMEGGPKDARYNRSKSGWFEGPLFEDWFISVALPYLKKLGEGPKAIIGDNLASHVSVQVLELCIKHNIKFLLLPPNSTHLCQPLDLAYFSPLKQAWRKLLQDYKSKCRGAITKDVFPRKLKEILAKIEKNSEANLKAGFAASGIYPLDPQRVLNHLPQKENANAELWAQNFEEFLKSKRQTETQGIRKRRKVTTVPGKSLSTPEVLEDIKNKKEEQAKKKNKDTPGTSGLQNVEISKAKIRRRSKVKTMYNLSDSSEDEFDQISLHDTDSDIDPEDFTDMLEARADAEYARDDVSPDEDQTDKNETEENIPPQKEKTESALEVGDFVAVHLKYNEGTKKEVVKKCIAKVIKITDSAEREQNIQLDFLKNYRGSKDVFVFPDVKDILFVNETQILEKIKPLSVNRGIYTFNDVITT